MVCLDKVITITINDALMKPNLRAISTNGSMIVYVEDSLILNALKIYENYKCSAKFCDL